MFPLESEPGLTGEKHLSLNVPDLPDKRAAETQLCPPAHEFGKERRACSRPAASADDIAGCLGG